MIYSYEVFTARVNLAALDHNFHLFRSAIEGREKKSYSKRSKSWKIASVKEAKTYDYRHILRAEILKRRAEDEAPLSRLIQVSPANPQNLAHTIAMRAAPPTKELIRENISRFQNKKNLMTKKIIVNFLLCETRSLKFNDSKMFWLYDSRPYTGYKH